jgi:hypothetical protein
MAKSTPSFSLGFSVSSGLAGTLRRAAIFVFQKASKSAGAGIEGWIFSGATAAPSAFGLAPGTLSVTSTYTMPGSSSFASMAVGLPGTILPWPISSRLFLRIT